MKERGRDRFDMPGGGMEYNEDFESALRRELQEEIGYDGKFTYEVIGAEKPHLLLRGIWQVRIVFKVVPETFEFTLGVDSDEMKYVDPNEFENSDSGAERLVCYYGCKLKGDTSYNPDFPPKEKEKG